MITKEVVCILTCFWQKLWFALHFPYGQSRVITDKHEVATLSDTLVCCKWFYFLLLWFGDTIWLVSKALNGWVICLVLFIFALIVRGVRPPWKAVKVCLLLTFVIVGIYNENEHNYHFLCIQGGFGKFSLTLTHKFIPSTNTKYFDSVDLWKGIDSKKMASCCLAILLHTVVLMRKSVMIRVMLIPRLNV